MSWWAYSFPTVAMTVATILMYHLTNNIFYNYLFIAIFLFLTSIMLFLIMKTIAAVKEKDICVLEE